MSPSRTAAIPFSGLAPPIPVGNTLLPREGDELQRSVVVGEFREYLLRARNHERSLLERPFNDSGI